jgi:CDP-glucose 4,6-dehydratase
MYWIYCKDILQGYIQLAINLADKPDEFSGSWNFASGENYTVEEIAEIIAKHSEMKYIIEETSIFHEDKLLQIDPSKAIAKLGWTTKDSVENSLVETINWYHVQRIDPNELQSVSDEILQARFK